MKNLAGFIFPHTDAPKTHPISPFPIRIRPKPAQFYTQTFGERHFGAYAFAPLHGYVHNSSSFIFPHAYPPKTHPILGANRRRGSFRGVCFCVPTRVYEKFGRFHIPPPEYTKNAPDFPLSNRDAPKTRPVLGLNRRRETFRGVCFCVLHGYVKNLSGFTFSQ